MTKTIALLFFCFWGFGAFAQSESFEIWPGEVPGESKPKAKDIISSNKKNNVTRIAEVTNPTLDVYLPEKSVANGAAVMICPGGGYHILAIDLEGSEIALWLNDLGYAAFVLHYRVPQKYEAALDDAKRAMRLIRSRAPLWNINPEKLGVIGFSAGGSLVSRLAACDGNKTYEATDNVDKLSYRPNATCVIYSGGIVSHRNERYFQPVLDEQTSPFFLFQTQDDHPESMIKTGLLLQENGVPYEMHVVPRGGHGYGLRKGSPAAELWPVLAGSWFKDALEIKD